MKSVNCQAKGDAGHWGRHRRFPERPVRTTPALALGGEPWGRPARGFYNLAGPEDRSSVMGSS